MSLHTNLEVISELEETSSTDQLDYWKGEAQLFKLRYELLTKLRNKAAGRIEREELTFEDDDELEEEKQRVSYLEQELIDTTSSTAIDITDFSSTSGEDPLFALNKPYSNATIATPSTMQTRQAGTTTTTTTSANSCHNNNNNNNNSYRRESSRKLAQASSTLQFQDINVVVINKRNRLNKQLCRSSKSAKQQQLLTRVSGQVKQGQVLAIMGPNGGGKTMLMNVLTLDAQIIDSEREIYQITGSIRLNGHNLTANLFKKHCFVVKQEDRHWPHLTARETLQYAAGIFHCVATTASHDDDDIVEETIQKMGLSKCADTRCINLSSVQKLRLSIAVALLKQPTVLFLDEPTSGLADAPEATCILSEISRVAKEENIIIVCTVHQPPSTKAYNNGFLDQIMLLSHGREAFHGNYRNAVPHFTELGYPLPEETNPAEFFLDLVNEDFMGEREVKKILDEWEKRNSQRGLTSMMHCRSLTRRFGSTSSFWSGTLHDSGSGDHGNNNKDFERKTASPNNAIPRELYHMLRRHLAVILRDPVLYVGRCVLFLVMNTTFAFVFWNARKIQLNQIYSKVWVQVWFVVVPLSMGVFAVFALNDEFKSIQREIQNGMSQPFTYILAKCLLVRPIFFVSGIFALVIPSFVIQATPWSALLPSLILYAVNMLFCEAVAECLSVAFADPIRGMLGYLSFGVAGFLFGGVLIPTDDLYWPFKLFSYILPFGYYIRSIVYITFSEIDWCNVDYIAEDGTHILTTLDVLRMLKSVFPLVSLEDTVWKDTFVLLGISAFWKSLYIILVMTTTRKVARIKRTKPALQQVQDNDFDELQ